MRKSGTPDLRGEKERVRKLILQGPLRHTAFTRSASSAGRTAQGEWAGRHHCPGSRPARLRHRPRSGYNSGSRPLPHREVRPMRRFLRQLPRRLSPAALFVLAASLTAASLAATPLVVLAQAQAAPCKAKAAEKKLAGAALKSFMTKCEKNAATTCEASAAERKLSGAARTSFTRKCVTDATGT